MFLQKCWPYSIANSKLIQNSHVLVLSTGLANRTLLKMIFPNNTLMYAFKNNLFESHAWVIIDPAFDGSFINCLKIGTALHTDWFAFRPSAISFNKTNFTRLDEIGNLNRTLHFLCLPYLKVGNSSGYLVLGLSVLEDVGLSETVLFIITKILWTVLRIFKLIPREKIRFSQCTQ